MASTRSRNTPGDYALEMKQYTRHAHFMTHHENVGPMRLPGNGLLGQECPANLLAHNAIDIESSLRGIGSTNLVSPQSPVQPEMYNLKSLDICERNPVIKAEPFALLQNQRPLPVQTSAALRQYG